MGLREEIAYEIDIEASWMTGYLQAKKPGGPWTEEDMREAHKAYEAYLEFKKAAAN